MNSKILFVALIMFFINPVLCDSLRWKKSADSGKLTNKDVQFLIKGKNELPAIKPNKCAK